MPQAEKRLKVLFLCTGNSCRSQMAEGWARELKGEMVEPHSAGIETHGLNPLAVKVMAEAGVDISGHRSKHVKELEDVDFDYVVTVCNQAHESCPVFPGKAKIVHRSFEDPPRLAEDAKTEQEALAHYRRVRDEIRGFVEDLPEALQKGNRTNTENAHEEATRKKVREEYAEMATGRASGCCGGDTSCCGASDPGDLARGMGYSDEELADLPEGANMGLSCGNPTALASLQEGEFVLDLGAGGGFDVFIAARKVGASGRAIGVDMTPEMVTKARQNAEVFQEQTGLANVEFRLGEIEHLPVADSSVDVIISNCVINLSPDKPQVWREMARVLKPGGRVAVSDIALKEPLPEALQESLEALVGCVAGAVPIEDTRRMAEESGLTDIRVEEDAEAVDAMTQSNDGLYQQTISALPSDKELSDYVVSIKLNARKSG